MALDLKVPDGVATHVKDRALAEYKLSLERYGSDLFAEASRLEAATSSASGDPEITTTMIKDADILLRRAYAKRRKSRVLIGAQLVSVVGSFVTGLLLDVDKLKEPRTMVLFIGLLSATIVATVITVLKD